VLAETRAQRRVGADAGHRRGRVHEQADADTTEGLARSAARRLCSKYGSDKYEPKLVIARRLEVLIDLTLEAVESGYLGSLEQYLDGIVSAGAQGGFCDADFFLASAETRRALMDGRAIHGRHTALYSYWRVLRHAEDYFLRRVAAHLEAQRPAEELRTIALLEELPQALVLIDEEARIQYANARIKPLFGLRPREATGRHLLELTKPRLLSLLVDPTAFLAGTARILTVPNKAHEDVFRLQNGSTYLRRSLPLKPDGWLRNLIIVTDLTPPHGQPSMRTSKNPRLPKSRATKNHQTDAPTTPVPADRAQLDETAAPDDPSPSITSAPAIRSDPRPTQSCEPRTAERRPTMISTAIPLAPVTKTVPDDKRHGDTPDSSDVATRPRARGSLDLDEERIIECLRCGATRRNRIHGMSCFASSCPHCGYVGWAFTGDLSQTDRLQFHRKLNPRRPHPRRRPLNPINTRGSSFRRGPLSEP
jgi:PAS domain-containing protein